MKAPTTGCSMRPSAAPSINPTKYPAENKEKTYIKKESPPNPDNTAKSDWNRYMDIAIFFVLSSIPCICICLSEFIFVRIRFRNKTSNLQQKDINLVFEPRAKKTEDFKKISEHQNAVSISSSTGATKANICTQPQQQTMLNYSLPINNLMNINSNISKIPIMTISHNINTI